jgi:type II secretory pathway pseudopilin PulG
MNARYLGKLRIARPQRHLTGFTLVELLVAASITAFVVGSAMLTLTDLLQINQQAESETLRRQDLNRSLDFMSDEIRRASSIYTNAAQAETDVKASLPSFSLPAGAKAVLSLRIPIPPANNQTAIVIYYIQNTSSPWVGDRLIRRWGPPIIQDGSYEKMDKPGEWDLDLTDGLGDVLVDQIESTLPVPNSTCLAGWAANPALTSREGFYNCVSPDGRSTEIHMRAHLASNYGGAPTVYEVSSNISARSRQ